MMRGVRIFMRDKTAFREENGALRKIGNPMDIVRALPGEVKIVHIVDLNAKSGNATNFDLYDHMMYRMNIEVEVAAKEGLVKKLLEMGARAVLEMPCMLDLGKFGKKALLVGKISGDARDAGMHDYYLESEDSGEVRKIAKEGKRVFLYSKDIPEKDAEEAGVFALIRDY